MSLPAPAPGVLLQRLLMGVLCLIWGSTYLVIRVGLADLAPLHAAAARFLVAWIVLLFLAPPLARREGGARPTIGLVLALGGLNVAVGYAVLYRAETRVPSGLAAVLWAVFPLLMAVGAHRFVPGERLRARQAAGFVVGFLGVALLFRTDLARIGPEAVGMGALLLVSPLVNTFGTLYLKRRGAGTSSALLNRDGMLVGALGLATAAFLLEDGAGRWSGRAVFSVLYLALVGTVLAFTIYYWLLRHAPASELSLIAYVIPAIALTFGALVGGEPFSLSTLEGSAVVLAGVALARRPGARGVAPAPRPAAPLAPEETP